MVRVTRVPTGLSLADPSRARSSRTVHRALCARRPATTDLKRHHNRERSRVRQPPRHTIGAVTLGNATPALARCTARPLSPLQFCSPLQPRLVSPDTAACLAPQ